MDVKRGPGRPPALTQIQSCFAAIALSHGADLLTVSRILGVGSTTIWRLGTDLKWPPDPECEELRALAYRLGAFKKPSR